MKYLKIFFTLIFVIAGLIVYRDNDWMGNELIVNFTSVPFYDIRPLYTNNGFALAAAFLLGMLFTLIHSSLNWIDVIRKNRKIGKLEREISKLEESKKETS